jgi:hypothetical protein
MESDNMGMLHPLEHLQLIVHHTLVAFDILLEYDLDGYFAVFAICFSNDSVCACPKSPPELVLAPESVVLICKVKAH